MNDSTNFKEEAMTETMNPTIENIEIEELESKIAPSGWATLDIL
jgi:hypothetical protein